MNILYAGNMANVGYIICKQLRKYNLDIDLLMQKNPKYTSDPLKSDPSLNEKYPDWIKFFDKNQASWKFDVIKKMRDKKYDLIHGHVEFPIFAYFSRKPYISQTLGSDLRELAFSNSIRGFLLRRALRKAKVVFFSESLDPSLLQKLKINTGIHLPLMWDTDFFHKKEINKNEFSENLTLFHPTNLDWRLKGNDIFLKGFSKHVKKYPNIKLIIVDRGVDSKKTHQLVSSLKIEKYIKFIAGPLNSSELLHYYNLCDIVADQFVLDGVGGIGAETFSCEKPLLTYCTSETYGDLYAEPPPVINANKIEDVVKGLELLTDNNFRLKKGKEGRKWITAYHSGEKVSQKMRIVYEMVIEGQNINKIKDTVSS